jgi:hypothetical protein
LTNKLEAKDNVQGDYHRCTSHPKPDYDTSNGHLSNGERRGLNNSTSGEEDAANIDRHLSAVSISGSSSEDGSNEGTTRGN